MQCMCLLSKLKQAIAVAAIALIYFARVKGGIKVLANMESKFPMFSSGKTIWVPVLGLFYVLVGVLHFPVMKDVCNIVPDRWGVEPWLIGVYCRG